ncbi:hypothetical protein [Microbulbifer magnicolonia]|uniref:hypothetical protein n=1 Tax=Microbulbifer magnicolonia TaxID=3109744 RepID=UPI002B401120|nr:hypothetical protein [Microbulbifer sp. GG15]
MKRSQIDGVFIRAHGHDPRLVVKRKITPFQDQYDIYRPWSKIDIVKKLVNLLDEEFDFFLNRFEEVDSEEHKNSSHRIRRYISRNKQDLFPNKDEEFQESHCFEYKNYWVGTNIGAKEISLYVREMCLACNISFGSITELSI